MKVTDFFGNVQNVELTKAKYPLEESETIHVSLVENNPLLNPKKKDTGTYTSIKKQFDIQSSLSLISSTKGCEMDIFFIGYSLRDCHELFYICFTYINKKSYNPLINSVHAYVID